MCKRLYTSCNLFTHTHHQAHDGWLPLDTTKLTREEALRRWNTSKENKRKMVEKLENLVRKSCLERTGKEPIGVEVW